MDVLIDGMLYVPAKTVIVDRRRLLRGLVEVFWGPEPNESDEWFEEQAKSLWVGVRDDDGSGGVSVSEFLDDLVRIAE